MGNPMHRHDRERLALTRRALEVVANRWVLNITDLLAASPSPMRHRDLADALPEITAGSLLRTLQLMERDGLLRRLVEPDGPTQVHYQLTDVGASTAELSRILTDWAKKHGDAVEASRADYRRTRKVLDVRSFGTAR